MYSIDEVVARHKGPWRAVSDGDLKRLEVYLAQWSLLDNGVHCHPMSLLLVCYEVLDRCRDLLALHPANEIRSQFSCEKWILGERFEIATTKW